MKPSVALVVPLLDYGGSKRSVVNIANMLYGFCDVTVIVFDGATNVYDIRCPVIDLKSSARSGRIGKMFELLRRRNALRRIIQQRNIQLCVSFTFTASRIVSMLPHTTKRIISCRGYGDLLKREVQFARLAKRNIDGILFNSAEQRNYFVRQYPELSSRCNTLYNVFDEHSIKAAIMEPVEEDVLEFINMHKTICSIGRLEEVKGFDHLIKAFVQVRKQVSSAGLLFIGEGKEGAALEVMAEKSGYHKDILFIGGRKNPYKYMLKCTAAALTSHNEGFPNVIVEALGCGLPVVSVDCQSGPREILSGENELGLLNGSYQCAQYGILAPAFPGEKDYTRNVSVEHCIFADALIRILTDGELRKKYHKEAAKRFMDFTQKKLLNEYLDYISHFYMR